jgi:hypothetical protein
MSFLTPWAALMVGAIVIPALLLLYFLKLRRRMETVASTLLWRRAVQDLQVNAPFQRLRKSLLLLLQLLVLAAALLALARPVAQSQSRPEESVVLLIDHSGSMNALENGSTRLELAKQQAARLVRTFNRAGSRWLRFGGVVEPTRVMVIAFADRATIVAPFTTNMDELPALIQDIPPTDGRSNLREALELAEAYVSQSVTEQGPAGGDVRSRHILISDGAIADASELILRSGTMELIRIGESRDNVGITALRAQRSYENPEQISVFVQVQNFAPQSFQTDLALYVGPHPDELHLAGVQGVALGPAPAPSAAALASTSLDAGPADGAAASPAEREVSAVSLARNVASVSFDLVGEQGLILEARLLRSDALAADNRAFAVVPPPRKLNVLLVSTGNFLLESVLGGLPLGAVTRWTPEQYESSSDADLLAEGRARFDVVILDKHDTARLPPGSYLFFACVPRIEGVRKLEELGSHPVLWWDETDPLLRYVALEYVVVGRGAALELTRNSQTVAEGPGGPMIARLARDGRQYVLVSFAIEDSSWWQKPGFPIFAYNALRHLGSVEGFESNSTRPGGTVAVRLPAGAASAVVTRPDGRTQSVRADASGTVRFADTAQTGVYRFRPALPGQEHFAINFENALESDITPRDDLRIGQTQVQAGAAMATSAPEIWRWFAGAALGLLLLEWYVYNRRVML